MNEQFIGVYYWITRDLNLAPTEAMIYAYIHGFTVQGKDCTASLKTVGQMVGVTSRTACRFLKNLTERGLLLKKGFYDNNNIYQTSYRTSSIRSAPKGAPIRPTVKKAPERPGEPAPAVVEQMTPAVARTPVEPPGEPAVQTPVEPPGEPAVQTPGEPPGEPAVQTPGEPPGEPAPAVVECSVALEKVDKPKTIRKKKEDEEKFDAMEYLLDQGVSAQIVKDWLALRKAQKGPATLTAIKMLQKKVALAGCTLEEAMAFTCEKGWRGFFPESYLKEKGKGSMVTLEGGGAVRLPVTSYDVNVAVAKSAVDKIKKGLL